MRCLTVLYDARCGLCRWARSWLEGQETWIDLEFVAVGSPAALRRYPTLLGKREADELLVISDEGGVYRDGHAWIMCLHATVDYREWAGRLASPALLPLARQGFALLSKQRGRVSRWLGLASEAEIVEALDRVVAPACDWTRSSAASDLAKPFERDQEAEIPVAVGVEPTRTVGDLAGGPLGDPAHHTLPLDARMIESDPIP